MDPASDHRPLELGERARDLVNQSAFGGRRVDVLLIQVEIDPDRL